MKCTHCKKEIPKGKALGFDWGWFERPQEKAQEIARDQMDVKYYCDPKCLNRALEKQGRLGEYRAKCKARSGTK